MASYERHVGPWPIKRSNSVPDASLRLFTPNNSPPSFKNLLTKVDEDCDTFHKLLSEYTMPRSTTSKDMDSPGCVSHRDIEQNAVSHLHQNKDEVHRVETWVATIKSLVIVSMMIFMMLPLHIASFFRPPRSTQIRLLEGVPSTILLSCFGYLLSITIGTVLAVTWHLADSLSGKIETTTRKMWKILTLAAVLANTLVLWWIFVVLPALEPA